MMNRYSLTDYILSVKVPDELRSVFLTDGDTIEAKANSISIGGDNSYVGQISVQMRTAQWNTEGDPTGSYVHNKSKDRTGTIEVQINQVSDKVALLVRLYETYYSADSITEGLTLTISKATGNGNQEAICTGTDCYIQQIPNIQYGNTAGNQDWQFTCGRIAFKGDTL